MPTPLQGSQRELNFDAPSSDAGYEKWVTGRRVLVQELARRIHLPLDHQVEVWLTGGLRLRGKLQLKNQLLFIEEETVRHLELMVDHVPFTLREMESCVRLD